jgi:hypothetical protein
MILIFILILIHSESESDCDTVSFFSETEVEVIGSCRSVNAIAKWSLPVDEDSQSSGTAVLGVIAVKEPDEPVDAAPVSSRHIPQDIPLDVATHPSSERESASPVVYVLDNPAVFTQSCNGFSSV